MPLRVLLADESTTIKKVFKWALQDYGAEIFTLLVDDNLLSSIRTLKPDIIFLDSLLKRKSGYELSAEIKFDPDLSSIPIVILWSHFTPLNLTKFKHSKANESLEKPFSVTTLREKVQKWVPKLKTQTLSQHLTFPENEELQLSPVFKAESLDEGSNIPPNLEKNQEEKEEILKSPTSISISSSKKPNLKENPDLNRFDLKDEISLKHPPSDKEEDELLALEEEDHWVQKNVFKVDEPSSFLEDEESEKKLFFEKAITDLKPSETKLEKTVEAESDFKSSQDLKSEIDLKEDTESFLKDIENSSLTSDEKKIQNQSKEIIESIAWKIVPELASQIIEKEIKRLLSEKEEDL